ncbi:penicillin-binding protein activator [Legionella impletisoli]|uniref:Penicillin-binding protein activator n=1 Tax=Legionella impletisoli TaxID=343510 RepID=A0A917JUN2_9GAMM|nr:penicillin-binding protein activator [Legionella impletisoli]GGI86947.1 penicillin-binding protein activator [Legionella impletisoli]
MKSSIYKLSVLYLCFLLLTGCANVSDTPMQVNQQLASPYTMPAATYLAQAKERSGEEEQRLRIMAAGRLIHEGQWQQGQAILSRVNHLSSDLADKKNLLLAKIEIIRDRPQSAVKTLAKIQNIQNLPIYYQAQYHELLAEAYKNTSKVSLAVEERIKLSRLLPDEPSKANNLRALWLALATEPTQELNTLALEEEDGSELKGWIELALLSREDYSNPGDMVKAIQNWKSQYTAHPAHSLLNASSLDQKLISHPRQVALLLPLSGSLGGPGMAIRDGFMAAYKRSQDSGGLTVRFYDTNQSDPIVLYQQALDEGADYVVGPLTKSDVAKVASLNHPVPTLFLNDLNGHVKENAYQFGLSPTNEARQVASKARLNGHTRALVIAPEGGWGDEVVAAFSQQWRANGGRVVDTLQYGSNDNLNQSIRDFLHISNSEARKKAIKEALGRNIEATPRRRQDFDMVFLLAYPSKARQIMPLLRYYYAGDVPVYSTSSVYGGHPNSLKDRDLNGIMFCDMPWVFEHNLGYKSWPEQLNSYNRLYALGMDSYELSNQLNQLLVFPAMGVRDKSGILYLNPNGQIARISAWGQFKQGLVEPMNKLSVT